jgi:hypothetical protein
MPHINYTFTVSVSIPEGVDPNEIDYRFSYDDLELDSEIVEVDEV